jgi:LPXTG-motif cell wall-anchored protein
MVTALATVAGVEGAFLLAGWLAYRKRRTPAQPA